MGPEEYDAFIKDPTGYWGRVYLPRVMGSLEPLKKLAYPLCGSGATSSIPSSLSAYGLPEVQAALEKMMQAGRETLNWQQKVGAASRHLNELGYPSLGGGTSKAPLDLIGDSMRGFRGVIMDMYQRPQKLLAAMEALVPILIEMGVKTSRMGSSPTVAFAMHKGADGFMSDEQFKVFYWAPLKKVMLGLIQEGLIPRMGAQGGYNSRLEVIRDLPKGKTIWAMGQGTDMARAKKILGDTACLSGNIPASLIHGSTPEGIIDHCRRLIEVAGQGGGYMFATAQGVNRNSKIENVRAMIQAGKEYGVYK
jgi:uroporphyrinogen-III decarboxylase